MALAEILISWLTPLDCIICGAEGANLCLACQETEVIPYGERCFGCGSLSGGCRTCQNCRRGGAPSHVWLTTDYGSAAQSLVTTYKFNHRRSCAVDVAKLMQATLYKYNDDEMLNRKNYLISHIPTATSRVRQRGFDHAKLIARQISIATGLEQADLLIRLGQSQQVGASRTQRQRQAEGTYRAKDLARISGRNILLIDDVVTTGATLAAAAKQLRRAGAKSVDGLVFAKRL
jgi:ComF family protein